MEWVQSLLSSYGLAGAGLLIEALVIKELFRLLVASYNERNEENKATVKALQDNSAALDKHTGSIDALTRALERRAA